jgi:hypothetical protein
MARPWPARAMRRDPVPIMHDAGEPGEFDEQHHSACHCLRLKTVI